MNGRPTHTMTILKLLLAVALLAVIPASGQADEAGPQPATEDLATTPMLLSSGPSGKRQPAIGDFVKLGSGEPAEFKTEINSWYDVENFTIRVRCYGKPRPQLVAEHRERDSDVWQDDSFDVFIATNPEIPTEYWHVVVNPSGGILDEYVGHNVKPDRTRNIEGLRVSLFYQYDWWQATLTIPYDSLGVDVPQGGDIWRLNVSRYTPGFADYEDEWSTWAPLSKPTFHYPKDFGYLKFGEEGPEVIIDEEAIKASKEDMEQMGIKPPQK